MIVEDHPELLGTYNLKNLPPSYDSYAIVPKSSFKIDQA